MRLKLRAFLLAFTTVLTGLAIVASPLSAQYGGISGLFVTTNPDNPDFADFSGLGCAGGVEVVLYFPGLAPTANDPVATQSVPGRIVAVGTTVASDDPLLDGTFTFPNLRLPDVPAGSYEVHSRCGDLDLTVIIEIDQDGGITVVRDPASPGQGTPTDSAPPSTLPITGRNSDRVVALAAGTIGLGFALLAAGRRARPFQPSPSN